MGELKGVVGIVKGKGKKKVKRSNETTEGGIREEKEELE